MSGNYWTGADRVDNALLRDAYLEANVRPSFVARECGFCRRDGHADGQRVLRMLGLRGTYGYSRDKSVRYVSWRRTVAYGDAVRIADAIGVDYVDVGI